MRGRLSIAHMLILLAGLLAVLLNFAVLRSRDASVDVLVASRDLATGQIIDAEDIGLVALAADEALLDTLLTASNRHEAVGQILTSPIAAGDLIRRSDLRPSIAASGLRAMSIPIDRNHASGGAIAVGDSVDVIAVTGGVAEYIAVGLDVIDLATSSSGGLGGGQFFVTVAVDSVTALRLAYAIDAGSLEILRSTGASPPNVVRFPDAITVGDDDAGT